MVKLLSLFDRERPAGDEATTPIRPFPKHKVDHDYVLPCGMPVPTKPYKYQQEGIRRITDSEYLGLFDIPGLGKSLQLIYGNMNSMYLRRIDCMVLFCRRSHKSVWVDEQLPEHAPHLKVHSILGVPPAKRKLPWPMDCHVYVVNYELMSLSLGTEKLIGGPDVIKLHGEVLIGADIRNLIELLRKKRCALVPDESHVISNPKAKVTRVLQAIAPLGKRRYCSSGTPAAERPDNLWSQIRFLDGGELLGDDYDEFLGQCAVWKEGPDGKPYIKRFFNLDKMAKKIAPIYLRRTDLSELPPKVIKPPVYLEPYAKQAEVIATLSGVMVSDLLAEKSKGARTVSLNSKTVFGGAFHRITRAGVCPWLIDPSVKESVKLDDLGDFLDEIGDASIIVWCIHKNVAEEVSKWIARYRRSRSPIVVTGDYSHGECDRRVKAFKERKYDTLIATIDKLKEAGTLTVAHYAYYMQFNFSLLGWGQSQKRIHRIGQKHTVIIRFGFVVGTLDELAFNKVVKKEGNSGKIMGDVKEDPEVIGIDELLKALGYSKPVNAKGKKVHTKT